MKKIKIEDIDFDLEYEGYIWYSNEPNPKEVKKIRKEDFSELPFIVEGNLFAQKSGISIQIKNIDGNYFVTQGLVNELPEDQITHQEFLAHNKLDRIQKIKTIQYWEESEKDDLLEGMKTLKPSWTAFVGFIKD